jgi:hypothetical protein
MRLFNARRAGPTTPESVAFRRFSASPLLFLLSLSFFLSFIYLFIYLFILAEGSKWKLTTEPAHVLF